MEQYLNPEILDFIIEDIEAGKQTVNVHVKRGRQSKVISEAILNTIKNIFNLLSEKLTKQQLLDVSDAFQQSSQVEQNKGTPSSDNNGSLLEMIKQTLSSELSKDKTETIRKLRELEKRL